MIKYPVSFDQFQRQLKNMGEWFYHYSRNNNIDVRELSYHIRMAEAMIYSLMAREYEHRLRNKSERNGGMVLEKQNILQKIYLRMDIIPY